MSGAEWLDHRLITVTTKPLYDNLQSIILKLHRKQIKSNDSESGGNKEEKSANIQEELLISI